MPNSVARFDSIFIANRGEIARRILRTAQRLGYRVIVGYSDADAGLAWLREADCSVRIGPASAKESYLNGAAMIAAAKASGAQAIHPGYGFLAENADFAQSVLDSGLVWIGPPIAAMRALGNKAAAKRLLEHAEVPLLPGYQGEQQDLAFLQQQAERLGLPLMIKAAGGGGGRGMRLVQHAADLASALQTARSESELAFGSSELILERALLRPRHIEVQIFADSHGNVVHLGERECSLQRRHQKIIEESPSPIVDSALRARLGAAAIAVAHSVAYQGAGTVEFLLDASGEFWFMEMNTRLQVEHTVTEEITGLDLVEWQIDVAQGGALALPQAAVDALLARGLHAIEVRLCLEDPQQDFLPQAGKLAVWQPNADARVENAMQAGEVVSSHYDSMLAKIIASGSDREHARRRLLRALERSHLLGVTNNLAFLQQCLRHPEFIAARLSTDFVAEHQADLLKSAANSASLALAASVLFAQQRQPARYATPLQHWASNGQLQWACEFYGAEQKYSARWQALPNGVWQLGIGGETWLVQVQSSTASGEGQQLQVVVDGECHSLAYCQQPQQTLVSHQGHTFSVQDTRQFKQAKQAALLAGSGSAGEMLLRAPFNGRIVRLLVTEGQQVAKGDVLLVLEAMKMEHSMRASTAGIVSNLAVAVGSQVQPGAALLRIVSV